MDEITEVLLVHAKHYPHAQVQDFIKLLYQNEFGCAHAADTAEQGGLSALTAELEESRAQERDIPPYEPIGNGYCRLHAVAVKKAGLHPLTMVRLFRRCAVGSAGSAGGFHEKLNALFSLCDGGILPFSRGDAGREAAACLSHGAPSHSEPFRRHYAPCYRVVQQRDLNFFPLFCAIDRLLSQDEAPGEKPHIAAIDGPSGSGKTTLAALLSNLYFCNLYATDDFFLAEREKTASRLAVPGGNVDHERIQSEIISNIRQQCRFSYRPFDCKTQRLGQTIAVQPCRFHLLEGTYSLHPSYRQEIALKVFLSTEETTALGRIYDRCARLSASGTVPGALYNRYVKEWIPLEQRYFNETGLPDACDFHFHT